MDISLLNPFAHAVPKSVDASITHANAACIAFNHSSTAPALLQQAQGARPATEQHRPQQQQQQQQSTGAHAPAPAPDAEAAATAQTADNRPHSLFAGHYLAAGRLDGIVAIWDIETRSCLRWFDAHARQVTSVAWSPHGRYLASSSLDWNVIVWDLGLKTGSAQPARKRTIRFDAPVLEVRFSPVSSLLLLAVLETQQAYIIDLRRPKYTLEQVLLNDEPSANDQAGPSSELSMRGTQDPAGVEAFPPYPLPPDAGPLLTLEPSTYSAAAFTPDGKLVFAGTSKGHLHIVDPQTGKTLSKVNATSPSGIRALAFDRTGSKLVVNVHDRTIRTFFVEYNYAQLANRPGWPYPVREEAANASTIEREEASDAQSKPAEQGGMDLDGDAEGEDDENTATPGGDNDTVMRAGETSSNASGMNHVNPSNTKEPVVSLLPVHKLIDLVNRTPWNGIGWSGDGGEYVYAGAAHKASHNIYIWDTGSGTLEKVLQGPKDPLVDVDWHPTRPVIASVCSTGAIHFWFSKSEEAWSAYAPQFEELEENVQYEEREEEFDLEDEDELSRRKQDEEEALVDITVHFAHAHPPRFRRLVGAGAAKRKATPLPPPPAPLPTTDASSQLGEGKPLLENGDNTESGTTSLKAAQPNGHGANEQPTPSAPVVANGPTAEETTTDVTAVSATNGPPNAAGAVGVEGTIGATDSIGDVVMAVPNGERAPASTGPSSNGAASATNGDAGPPPSAADGVPNGDRAPPVQQGEEERTARSAYVWRWVRSGGEHGGVGEYESDDDVDPCFVIPVQLEDGNSSSEGSSRSD